MKQPELHAPALQIFAALQAEPSASGLQSVVEIDGWQVLQTVVGLASPLWRIWLEIQHAPTHAPAEQTSPVAQLVPSASGNQSLVVVAGLHFWQGSVGFSAAPR